MKLDQQTLDQLTEVLKSEEKHPALPPELDYQVDTLIGFLQANLLGCGLDAAGFTTGSKNEVSVVQIDHEPRLLIKLMPQSSVPCPLPYFIISMYDTTVDFGVGVPCENEKDYDIWNLQIHKLLDNEYCNLLKRTYLKRLSRVGSDLLFLCKKVEKLNAGENYLSHGAIRTFVRLIPIFYALYGSCLARFSLNKVTL